MARKTVGFNLRLPPELHERLSFAATNEGVSLNSLICRALERAGKPSKTEMAAVAILRRQAFDAALQVAEPGETNWITENRADRFLAYIIGA